MGEPGPTSSILKLPPDNLTLLFRRQHPQAVIDYIDDQYVALTVHGVGDSEQSAMQSSLKQFADMKRDGETLRQLLNDVITDLSTPGMSRERHDSLINLLDIAENSLNHGILTSTIDALLVPSYTREIADLRRRTDTRLNMIAQEMQQRELAAKRAAQQFPRRRHHDEESATPVLLSWAEIIERSKQP